MGESLRLRLGEDVPVFVQLEDGATNQFPRALVYDPDENLLQTIDLDHSANGLYVPGTPYVMPNEDYIRIVGIVYSDSGHTTLNTGYGRTSSVYSLNLDALQTSVDAIPTNPLLDDDARLDFLDASISDMETEVSASFRHTQDLADHDATQALIAALNDLSASEVTAAVWDAQISGYLDSGSTGEALSDAGAVSDPGAIAEAVWDEKISGHLDAGSTGLALNTLGMVDVEGVLADDEIEGTLEG
jgi:hypothetical protein